MRQIPDPPRDAEALQQGPTRWIQAIAAHFFPGKFFPLKNKRPQTSERTKRRAARSGRAAAHDRDIKNFHLCACEETFNAEHANLNVQRFVSRVERLASEVER